MSKKIVHEGRLMSGARQRVGLLAPAWIPIPPPAYGGIEQVVALMARGLTEAGHDVTLAAPRGSALPGVRVIETTDTVPERIGLSWEESSHALAGMRALEGSDVIIDHSGPFGAFLAAQAGAPALHVIHGPLGPGELGVYEDLAERAPSLRFIAISDAQRRAAPGLPFAGVCHNGLDIASVPFEAAPGGYLAFLGRISPDKGPSAAIRIARELGMPLLIAAKCREEEERRYFDAAVAPHLDGQVRYVGELDGHDKFSLLAGARALVFPIDWEEPFGMVMIEAMACGTPVLATRRGAVPEVVVDGETGFVCDDLDGLVEAAARLADIDRRRCRAHVEERFSVEPFTRRYEEVIAAACRSDTPPADVRELRTRLPRSLESLDVARGLVDRLAETADAEEETRDAAELLVSELVTNSVLHADGEEVGLSAQVTEETLRVEVVDDGPGIAVDGPVSMPSPYTIGGRGLGIVERMATRWGHDRSPARVWFELPRRSGAGRAARLSRLGGDASAPQAGNSAPPPVRDNGGTP